MSQHMTKPTIRLVRPAKSDQRVHPPSLARVLVQSSLDSWRLQKAHAISKYSDQTARMRRLVCVFTCRIKLIVRFIVHWLI